MIPSALSSTMEQQQQQQQHLRMQEFEKRQAHDFATVQNRIQKKPILETLANPSSFLRALLILPMPWVSLYIVVQLSQQQQQQQQDSLMPMGFLAAFFIGYFLIDLVTGLVHMRFDTLPLTVLSSQEQTRTALELIAWGFQRHHAVQQNWLHDDLLESGILTTGFFAVPFYFLFLALYRYGILTSPYTAFGWTVFVTAGMHVQVFHAAAHNTWKGTHPRWQAFLRQLQTLGLILDPKAHHFHHTQFDCNFSLINGWSNHYVLNPLYHYLEHHGYMDASMEGPVQRQVYIQKKAQLTEPYCRMFPEYRAYQAAKQKNDAHGMAQ